VGVSIAVHVCSTLLVKRPHSFIAVEVLVALFLLMYTSVSALTVIQLSRLLDMDEHDPSECNTQDKKSSETPLGILLVNPA
jgi:multisubunit Na+/H+ antiporter MnhG subunit